MIEVVRQQDKLNRRVWQFVHTSETYIRKADVMVHTINVDY